jgi:hypothetical protein
LREMVNGGAEVLLFGTTTVGGGKIKMTNFEK